MFSFFTVYQRSLCSGSKCLLPVSCLSPPSCWLPGNSCTQEYHVPPNLSQAQRDWAEISTLKSVRGHIAIRMGTKIMEQEYRVCDEGVKDHMERPRIKWFFWNLDPSRGRLNQQSRSSGMSRSCTGLVNHRIPSDWLEGKDRRQTSEGGHREATSWGSLGGSAV